MWDRRETLPEAVAVRRLAQPWEDVLGRDPEVSDRDDDVAPAATRCGDVRVLVLWAVAGAVLGVVAVGTGAVLVDEASVTDRFQPPPATTTSSALGSASRAESTPLPALTLSAFGEGRPVAFGDYRGTPLLVNFWATWCPPCVEEMQILQRVAGQADGRVAFLGVNVQDDTQKATAFIRELGVTYDQASDPAAELFTEVRGFGMPTTLLVDASGTIRYRHTGILDDRQLRRLLAVHLGVEL